MHYVGQVRSSRSWVGFR